MLYNLGILLYDDVEVLAFAGPFEVFSMALSDHPDSFSKVILIAETQKITTRGGIRVEIDKVIDDVLPELDILLIPGGYGIDHLINNQKVLNWIKVLRPTLKYLITVCSGVSILGRAGFLGGMVVTTHHTCLDEVKDDCPNSRLCTCRRFIDNDPFYISAGVAAGIDVSLYFLKKHFGLEMAQKIAQGMEYNWTDPAVDSSVCICSSETV